jgi:hypothetical protein
MPNSNSPGAPRQRIVRWSVATIVAGAFVALLWIDRGNFVFLIHSAIGAATGSAGSLWSFVGIGLFAAIVTGVFLLLLVSAGSRKGARPRYAAQDLGTVGVLGFCLLLGLLWVALTPGISGTAWITVELCSMGLFSVGALVGFLFGLPRSVDQSTATAQASPGGSQAVTAGGASAPVSVGTDAHGATRAAASRRTTPNTALERIGDSFAALIAGAGLANITRVPEYVSAFGTFLVNSGKVDPNSAGLLAAGLLLYFPALGFFAGYLSTKLVLNRAISRADDGIGDEDIAIIRDALPTLAEYPVDPTDADKAAARRVTSMPLTTLVTPDERATWGRAKAILEEFPDARIALGLAVSANPDNPDLLIDYARVLFTIYQPGQPTSGSISVIAALYAQALGIILDDPGRSKDLEKVAEVRSNLALVELYMPGGYVAAIDQLRLVLAMPIRRRTEYYSYLACALGQKWAAMESASAGVAELKTLGDEIMSYVNKVLDWDCPRYLRFFQMVSDRNYKPKLSADNDLEAFAAAPNSPLKERLDKGCG